MARVTLRENVDRKDSNDVYFLAPWEPGTTCGVSVENPPCGPGIASAPRDFSIERVRAPRPGRGGVRAPGLLLVLFELFEFGLDLALVEVGLDVHVALAVRLDVRG